MNLRWISLARFLFFLLEFSILEITYQTKNKRFMKPCFVEDENFGECRSISEDSCVDKNVKEGDFKLVRLPGVRTGHVRWMELEKGRSFKLITRAMRPLLFEIPAFLSDEECDHIMTLAKEMGLSASVIGRDQFYERDLDKAMQEADSNATLDSNDQFARDFNIWDTNTDGIIDNQEIKNFAKKYKALRLKDEEISALLKRLGIADDNPMEGKISATLFHQSSLKKILSYMAVLKSSSPHHRFRFSDQAWLRQDKTADHVLKRLHERIIKLTRLPRKIIQGSEDMQVVRYQTHGHYHAHFDSGLDSGVRCCHQFPLLKPPQCGICRFITILYYLNDVEQGGETAFPVADNSSIRFKDLENPEADEFNLSISCHAANLVLPPKKGTAIMWYNNFIDPESGLLGKLDLNSLHGGCDVIKGEKWIANNWLTAPTKDSKHIKSIYDVGFND